MTTTSYSMYDFLTTCEVEGRQFESIYGCQREKEPWDADHSISWLFLLSRPIMNRFGVEGIFPVSVKSLQQ